MSDVIVGIDLGTTNSLVAVCENGRPRVLTGENGQAMVPSVIHWGDEDVAPSIGTHAKKLRITDTSHTVYSVKRFIGRGQKDIDPKLLSAVDTTSSTDQNILLKLGKRSLSAIELSAEILKELKKIAEKSLGHPVVKAVITVPAYFNDSQRTATKAAGQIAGLDVVRIVNEPTAAALAYGIDRKKSATIAVYDLGGGTFDVSILKLQDGIFEVLSTGGDTELGGDDFDRAAAQLILAKHPELNQGLDLGLKALLLEQAEKLKFKLTQQTSAQVDFSWNNKSYRVSISRDEFNGAIEGLIQKTLKIAGHALTDAGLDKNKIDDVVMVGGSTRVPLVRQAVQNFFGKEINVSLNPDEVVALGAAIQANILSGHIQDMVLLDIVPLSLGIETYGGTVGKIIHRNTKIPSIAQETFTTHVDGQRNVLIHVLQGERELATDCRSLAKFNLKDLPGMPAGLPKIQVTFLVDANGILTVRAQELTTGKETYVEIKPTYGLTDEQVEKMLSDSLDFAEEDMKSRQLIDTRIQAEGVLNSAQKILDGAKKSVSQEEFDGVQSQMNEVRNRMAGQDYIAIKDALEKLEDVAKPLAALAMNNALKENLSHKRVEDVLKK